MKYVTRTYGWLIVLIIAGLWLSICNGHRNTAIASPTLDAPDATKNAAKMRLWIAAYYYPFGAGLNEWNRLIAAGRRVPIVVIVNPASGPGDHVDTNFAAIVPRARKSGLTLVGYIGTQYARKPIAQVENEVETYMRFYPELQGFHFDEQSSDAAGVAYYATLYSYVRRRIPNALVITNPGTACSSEYVSRPATDVVCLFENNQGFASFRPPSWAAGVPASRLCIQTYQVSTEAEMKQYLQQAANERIGYVYITDAGGSNPYNRLPSYWDAEVAAIEQMNEGATR